MFLVIRNLLIGDHVVHMKTILRLMYSIRTRSRFLDAMLYVAETSYNDIESLRKIEGVNDSYVLAC